jgi:hypothetical protein
MPTYKFPQFQVEITDPAISINLNTISDKALDKLLGVDVLLTTASAQFGVRAEDMPYTDTWDDADVPDMVNIWLAQYAV